MVERTLAGIEQYIGIKQKLDYRSNIHTYIIKEIISMVSWKSNFLNENRDRWIKNKKLYFNLLSDSEELDDKLKEQLGQLGELTIPIAYKVVKTILDISLEELERRRYYYELLPYVINDYPKVLFLNILLQNELKKQHYINTIRQILEDSAIYGCGILHISWGKLYKTFFTEAEIQGDKLLEIPTKKIVEKQVKFDYEGNIINVINPENFDFDNSFNILDIDKWRYCITRLLVSQTDLLNIVKNGYDFINTEIIERAGNLQEFFASLIIDSDLKLSSEEMADFEFYWKQGRKVLVENIYLKIIPKKFGLSNSSDEEIWLFTIVNRRLIIKASPLTYNHNKFPIVIYTWNGSLNEKYPASLMDYLEPLQSYINWLLRKYKENVNASINRIFLLNTQNLENPQDFTFDRTLSILKLDKSVARLPGAIDNTVRELNFEIKTGMHLNVIPMFMEIIRNISGISELHLGGFPSGRRTKGEIEIHAFLSSIGVRALLRNMHNWIGKRLIDIVTSNLRQFLNGNVLLEVKKDEFMEVQKISDIAQNLEVLETLTGRTLINLDMTLIKGEYDYYLGDYLEPSYDEKTLTSLNEFLKVVGNIPMLGQMVALIFKWNKISELLFRATGSKNPEDFINMEMLKQMPNIMLNMMTQNQQQQQRPQQSQQQQQLQAQQEPIS